MIAAWRVLLHAAVIVGPGRPGCGGGGGDALLAAAVVGRVGQRVVGVAAWLRGGALAGGVGRVERRSVVVVARGRGGGGEEGMCGGKEGVESDLDGRARNESARKRVRSCQEAGKARLWHTVGGMMAFLVSCLVCTVRCSVCVWEAWGAPVSGRACRGGSCAAAT